MKIGIIGSMQFSERMIEVANELRQLGHAPILSLFVESMIGKDDATKERLKLEQKYQQDAMKRDIEHLGTADAVLMLNFEKNGIPNYVGGNAFLECGWAHLNNKRIYFFNPIPNEPIIESELKAFRPVILNGNLSKIR